MSGRDGNPGIEVNYFIDNVTTLVVIFRAKVLVFFCYCSSQAYQGPQGLRGKIGRSGVKVTLLIFLVVKVFLAFELLSDHFLIVVWAVLRGRKGSSGPQEKWVPQDRL